ncbi:MAG: hypothetical protein ACE5GW_01735, partial [Planctomycetota bacterium]
PPFSATLGGFIDGSSYAFTVNLQAGGTDNMNLLHNAPQPGLYPTVSVSTTSGGKVLIDWEEISAQLLRPAAEVAVEIMQVQGMGDMTIFEEESLPVGRSWLKVYESLFTSGQTYRFEVYYLDVGGGIQAYAAEMQWP